MFNDTVTIFNRRKDPAGDMWYPTVLRGVELQTDRAAIVAKYGAQSADRALLFIHFREDENGQKIAGKKAYLPPKAWQAREDPSGTFTFTPGEAFDFFLDGAWLNEEPVADNAHAKGLYNYLNQTRDGVYAVNQVSVFKVIPHVEVTGR